MKTLQDRFDENYEPVTESGCWIWMASLKTPDGYGQIRVKGEKKYAHRVSHELHIGKIPEGLCVLHKCDIKCCVNPDHLFLGTQQDNMDDMIQKGRGNSPKGSKCGAAKLTEAYVLEIKQLLAQGILTQREIADKFGVSDATISRIKLGKNWKHL